MSRKKIVIILGAAASGKTFTQKEIVKELNAKSIVSFATRAKREGEIDGTDYHFVSKEHLLSCKNLNHIELRDGNLYAVPETELQKDAPILVYSVINLAPVVEFIANVRKMEDYDDIEIVVIFMDISREDRLNSLLNEGYSMSDAITRLNRQIKEETEDDFKRAGININLHIKSLRKNTQKEIISFLK